MLNHADTASRFATKMHFAPISRRPDPALGLGLFALGIGIGIGVVVTVMVLLKRADEQVALTPRRSAPVQEIDRWANEGGAVVTPALPRTP